MLVRAGPSPTAPVRRFRRVATTRFQPILRRESKMKTIFAIAMLLVCVICTSAQQRFVAAMDGEQEVPAVNTPATGVCKIVLNAAETQITVSCTFSGLTSD